MSRVRVGITPPVALTSGSPAARVQAADHVADVGIDHLFVADHVSFHGGGGSDGLVHAASLTAISLLARLPAQRIQPRGTLYSPIMLISLPRAVMVVGLPMIAPSNAAATPSGKK